MSPRERLLGGVRSTGPPLAATSQAAAYELGRTGWVDERATCSTLRQKRSLWAVVADATDAVRRPTRKNQSRERGDIMHPALFQAESTFKESIEAVDEKALDLVSPASFKFSLSYKGVSMGFMSIDSSGWCHFSNSGDGDQFEQYVYTDGKTYYRVKGGTWDGYYLSVNRNAYVGVYGWTYAVGWHFEGSRFICEYN